MRPSLESLAGWRRRTDWAHRNNFEAFPAFSTAVIVEEFAHAPRSRIDLLASIFVLLQLIYTLLYLADQATLRSLTYGRAVMREFGSSSAEAGARTVACQYILAAAPPAAICRPAVASAPVRRQQRKPVSAKRDAAAEIRRHNAALQA